MKKIAQGTIAISCALAMGVGVAALTIMDEVEPRNALGLLGIGVACLALVQLTHGPEQE